ncbi:hypothetical protein Hsar01_00305 [Haloferula sargassicola]|uniref:Thioesterase domain-containing protein n=2 Tax=Haloferula sargassicola TaxID=490096 RepID=A0ABP9UP69_9BACT
MGRWHPEAKWAGYAGILHGGLVATLLDAAMVHALFSLGCHGLTADMKIRFLRQVRIDAPVEVEGWQERAKAGLHRMESSLRQDGYLCAQGSASFMEYDATHFDPRN